ncbi:sulfatase-like hydrolase/transferase, partial [bacterium]|nr:sulfatase-like hydrolase/transferase [bacterium]
PLNQGKTRTDYAHDLMTDEALGFVTRCGKTPFFLYLAYTIPHAKLEVPSLEPYADKDWSKNEKAYAAMVTRMDRDIGRLMALLETQGVGDDTLVFFCSDNGAAQRWKRFESCGPLRGRKRDMYEGGLRVPMVARWPGKVKAGSASDLVWAFWDLLPTAADIAGVAPPKNIDGISILPTLLGREQKQRHEFLYWEFHEGGYKQAVRMGRWKAVRNAPGKPLELYDLEADPSEAKDIAAGQPDVVAKIEAYLKTARTVSKHWPGRTAKPKKQR